MLIPPASDGSDPLLHFFAFPLLNYGKRVRAERIVSRTLLYIRTLTRAPPLPVHRHALITVSPAVKCMSQKRSGKNVQNKRGKTVEERLAQEIIAVVNGDSKAITEKGLARGHAMVNRQRPVCASCTDLCAVQAISLDHDVTSINGALDTHKYPAARPLFHQEVTCTGGYAHKRNIFNLLVHNAPALLSLPPMTASSKLTEKNWHPSSLLAYDTLPGHQDFDPIISDAKSTADTGTDFYDRSLTSRRYALVGVACSCIFSCSCIVVGIVILANHGVLGVVMVNTAPVNVDDVRLPLQWEIFTLTLNLIITLCTESIGFLYGISLRSALASESRLRFNTNLRLLTAARGWYNPNGALLNGISAVLLIISYSSASLVVCLDSPSTPTSEILDGVIAFTELPFIILGVALLLQVTIALSAMQAVKILTWSSSPFDLTAALVHHTRLTPVTLRCMRCVSDPRHGWRSSKATRDTALGVACSP
ncbi:uncharacterized protein BJ212DRAFT_1581180 [Suillus subaureus]|uniref:Small ribosomal subunit protein uS7 domain-containing protein n=1 Tax=Suillus subaureus TaxID=48587 RepID=A0A9P7DU81_9AGAM|nr:uncharacterized protein BJ212DRAFT_1581180 [Suillus subaureus]KAG1803402.1 hypothetical protein BJ212DRAFT_1581180 [Suillus subaureus]